MADIWADWSSTAASNTPVGTDTPDDLHVQLQNIKAQVKGNAADIGNIQDGAYVYAVDAVGSDSYAITLTPALAAYADGQMFVFKASTANTGGCTLAVDGLTATAIKKQVSSAGALVALATGDILINQKCVVVYDSDASAFILINPTTTPGDTAQLVYTQDATLTLCTKVISNLAIPTKTDGTEVLTLAITPKKATNVLYIEAIIYLGCNYGEWVSAVLFKDANANAISTSFRYYPYTQSFDHYIIRHYEIPNSLDEITYKIRVGASVWPVTYNGLDGTAYYGSTVFSSLKVTEIVV